MHRIVWTVGHMRINRKLKVEEGKDINRKRAGVNWTNN